MPCDGGLDRHAGVGYAGHVSSPINSGPWARALAGAAGPFHFRGRNTRPTPSMANSHVSILMRQLQEKSAFFPNFYGVFVQRGGGDGPETRRAGGMSDGVMLCTYKLMVTGLRAGRTPRGWGGRGGLAATRTRDRRAPGCRGPNGGIASIPGGEGGAGAAGGTIASSSAASSTSPGRRAPAWNAGGARRPMGRLERPDVGTMPGDTSR